jgi:transglutaminase/protease-like cytokinesis protein 3
MVSQLQYQSLLSSNSTAQGPSNNKNLTSVSSQGSHSSSIMLTPNGSSSQDEDESVDQELKFAHIEMYKMKLRERERRRRVAREHQLIGQFFRENPLTYDGRGRAIGSGPVNFGQKAIKKSSSSQKVPTLWY